MITDRAIRAIQETAVEASGERKLPLLVFDQRRTYFPHPTPTEKVATFSIPVPPSPRQYEAHDLNTIINLAIDAKTEHPDIWVGPDAVVLIFDRDDRRDRADHPLPYTSQWATLSRLVTEKPKWLQAALISLLHIDLGVPPDLIAPLRNLRWARQGEEAERRDIGAESLGRSIEARVAGVDSLPESITINAAVYDTADVPVIVAVPCLIDYDLDNQRIRLVPESQAMNDAERVAGDAIAIAIHRDLANAEAKGIRIFRGRPFSTKSS